MRKGEIKKINRKREGRIINLYIFSLPISCLDRSPFLYEILNYVRFTFYYSKMQGCFPLTVFEFQDPRLKYSIVCYENIISLS